MRRINQVNFKHKLRHREARAENLLQKISINGSGQLTSQGRDIGMVGGRIVRNSYPGEPRVSTEVHYKSSLYQRHPRHVFRSSLLVIAIQCAARIHKIVGASAIRIDIFGRHLILGRSHAVCVGFGRSRTYSESKRDSRTFRNQGTAFHACVPMLVVGIKHYEAGTYGSSPVLPYDSVSSGYLSNKLASPAPPRTGGT